MAEALRERTARLLTDYLEFCARAPGSPARAPSTLEAKVLRYLATQVQQSHQGFLSDYRGYRGNRVALVEQLERDLFANPQNVSWGHIAALLIFAGTLLERPPLGTYLTLTPGQEQDLEWKTNVDEDCQHLVALLCSRLTGRHRAWLEAHDGWVSAGRTRGSGTGRAAEDAPMWPAPEGTSRPQPPVGRSFRQD